jgi:uncharacterized membrane protein YhaH (DUF805 family)
MEDNNTNQNSEKNAEKLQEISDIYNPQSSNGGENVVLVNRSPIEYYILAFQKYAQFSGRSTRNEYWWFYLVTFAVSVLAGRLDSILSIPFLSISNIYFLAIIIPTLSVSVRRLHDVDKSGWLILLPLLPIAFFLLPPSIILAIFVLIIIIWLFILTIRDSTPGANKYGPNPKGIQA